MEAQDNKKTILKETISFIITMIFILAFLIPMFKLINRFIEEFKGTEDAMLFVKLIYISPAVFLYLGTLTIINYVKTLKAIKRAIKNGDLAENFEMYKIYEKNIFTEILSIILSYFIDFIFIAFLVLMTIIFVREGALEVIPITSIFLFVIIRNVSYRITKKILNK